MFLPEDSVKLSASDTNLVQRRNKIRSPQADDAPHPKLDIYALLDKEHAPDFSADGPHIESGYRCQLSYSECLLSMFTWHNQTVNIWTSIALLVFNVWMAYSFTNASRSDMDMSCYVMFWVQGILRAICWYNSWMYHTFVCHSKSVANFCCNLDYVGCYLTPLGMGSNLLFIELYYHPTYQMIILVAGFVGIVLSIYLALAPVYQTEHYRKMRLALSVVSSLPYLVGLVLAIVVIHRGDIPTYYLYLAYAFAFEMIGAFFYVSMFPEIVFPKTFDCWLSSHSLWHWMNFGFDACMMCLSYGAFQQMKSHPW